MIRGGNMDIRNCRRCGRIYKYDGFPICPNCRMEDEKDFDKVKEYLDEYPMATVNDVSKDTEVPVSKIMDFLRQGRLELTDENNIFLECEKCGKPIKTGRFCDKCAFELEQEMKGAVVQPKKPEIKKEPKNYGKEELRFIGKRKKQ